jgi:hypothetical protein
MRGDILLACVHNIQCMNKLKSCWTSDEWSAEYGLKEQWRMLACHQQREEYSGSLFDNFSLLDTPIKSVDSKRF